MTKPEILRVVVSVVLVLAWLGKAQNPVIYPGGIVNSATMAPPGHPAYGVQTQSLASLFGENLASTTAEATGFPLPTSLGGTTVAFGGVPAPLLYVSPTQINLQVPSHTSGNSVVVTTAAGASDPMDAHWGRVPGIFTLNGGGCGRGAVFNIGADGAWTLNSPDNSVEPGGVLAMYGTGSGSAGYYGDPIPDGMPAPADPPARYGILMVPVINGVWYGQHDYTLFVGAAPGLAGVDQINLRVPDDVPDGCSVPLQFWKQLTNSLTPAIPISIHHGGGPCVDPPPQSRAVLRWTKAVTSGIDPPPSTDTLSIEFSSSVLNRAPDLPKPPGPSGGLEGISDALLCPGFERQLDAGYLFASGGLLPVWLGRAGQYTATLPPGTIQPGLFGIAATGGADVSPLNTTVAIPPPIQITSNLTPGTKVSSNSSLVVSWQGGWRPQQRGRSEAYRWRELLAEDLSLRYCRIRGVHQSRAGEVQST